METEKCFDGILEKIDITETNTNNVESKKYNWNVGDEIEAKDFMKKWYKARIMARNKKHGGRILVHFQGWSTQYDEWLPVDCDRIRQLNQTTNKQSDGKYANIKVGTLVYAPWRDGRIYPGKIDHLTRQSCFVRFYDGMCRKLKNKFIIIMNDKEQNDYIKEGYFKSSIFSSHNLNKYPKHAYNDGKNEKLSIKINKLLIKKQNVFGKMGEMRSKLKLSSKFLKKGINNKSNLNIAADSDVCSDTKISKMNLISNSDHTKLHQKSRNLSATKIENNVDSGPKARCSFCQKNFNKFVTRPSLNAMKQCYVCISCMKKYDERLKSHHLQAINEWLITGKLPSFQMEPQKYNKNKRKDDVASKSSDEVIMKTTNDVIADLTNIQKTLSYIDQVIHLLKDEKNVETLYFSLTKKASFNIINDTTCCQNQLSSDGANASNMNFTPLNFTKNSTNYTSLINNIDDSIEITAAPDCSISFGEILSRKKNYYESKGRNEEPETGGGGVRHAIDDCAEEKQEMNVPSTEYKISSSSIKRENYTENMGEFSRKIKTDLARMQAELARKILSFESTVGVLEAGFDLNKSAQNRQQFQLTLTDLNSLAQITNFI